MLDATTAESASAVVVRGETRCPRPDDVAATLGRMLAPPAPGSAPDVAEIREERSGIVVVLRRASGELVGEKRVPASLGCAARAEVTAVALAALEAQVTSGEVSPLEVTPPAAASGSGDETSAPSKAPAASAAPPPALRPLAAAAPTSVVVESAPVVVARLASRADEAPTVPARLKPEIGAGVLVGTSGHDIAPGGRLEVALRSSASAWWLSGAGTLLGTHEIAVGAGTGAWWRVGGELAVGRSLVARAAVVDVRAGAALDALSIEGHSFTKNTGATILDPGAVGGVRLTSRPARIRTWMDLSVAVWPRSHLLSVVGADAHASIPAAEALLGLGASLGKDR